MRIISTLAVVAFLATAPFASYAQSKSNDDHSGHHPGPAQAAPASPGGMEMKGGGMMSGDMGRMMAMMRGFLMDSAMMSGMPIRHVEGRLAFLKAELKITPAQEPQWNRFADVVRTAASDAQGAMKPMMQTGAQIVTAPEVLARQEKMLAKRLEAVRALKVAFDPLYASLSDEQKKVADDLVMSPMMM